MIVTRKCVDGGVGTGIPGTALGGGPGGQGTGPDPGGGGGGGTVGSVSSNSVTQYSVTAGCTAVDTVNELGAVGEFCWLQDTMVNAASERTMNGAINFGDVNDIGYSREPKLFGLIGSDSTRSRKR